ncbi:hypothetical protein ACWGKK_28175 [Streptomyces chartreusis]|uniref:hypothetical protein n=1 Tax=Streptomyces TaxID=1883 RepID=UPI0015A39724|nr:hypothetical protein [Streptomyces sp. KS_5]
MLTGGITKRDAPPRPRNQPPARHHPAIALIFELRKQRKALRNYRTWFSMARSTANP